MLTSVEGNVVGCGSGRVVSTSKFGVILGFNLRLLNVKLQGVVQESQAIGTDFQPLKVDFGCPNLLEEVDLDTETQA